MKQADTQTRKPGRPRGFDRDAALHAAMLTFWAHGYETTSITELSAAMCINAPALYSAFGDKERLYREAVALYAGDAAAQDELIQDAPSSKESAEMVMGWAIERFTGTDTPKGCLVGTSMATGSKASASVRKIGTDIRTDLHTSIARRIRKDIEDGIIESCEPDTLAALIVCTVQGFSTLARDGASSEKLRKVSALALQSWPSNMPTKLSITQ